MSTTLSPELVTSLKKHISAQRDTIWQDLRELTAFNSVHSRPECAQDHAAAAQWVAQALEKVGLTVETYPVEGGATTLIGRKAAQADAPTILLYAHYDVVPAGDPEAWTNNPFELTERDGRWYARGAADCKGNLVMHLAALRALAAAGGSDLGIIFLVEGSEEQGGAELSHLIETRPELFRSDIIFIADSGNAAVGVPTLTTSLRGGAQITVRVDTLAAPVHSGSFGGAAPDAVAALVRILDSLRDEHGRTVIDGVDTSTTWQGTSYDRQDFRTDAGILDGVAIMGTPDDDPADMVWARPAISITGFSSTEVAKAVNAVPATASACLNLRVPINYDSHEVAQAVATHIHAHTPWGARVQVDIDDVNSPFATDTRGQALSHLAQCLSAAYDGKEVTHLGSGGSIPLCSELIDAMPHAELALFGVEEPRSVIHSPDESVDPQEIIDIATAEAAFLASYKK
ncbi:dipeptidase [Corynebacterium sp. sy039]|uniref:dipeptidase n=1 Tax=Corynebacterium sp. sy039 TaxID=2599641 RepID=UPI0011B5791E|nr:dipeptidase [Corynebacterium sp. sy039]QDZ41895.1 dipeptidase [Corynebacterium sp. sy039]